MSQLLTRVCRDKAGIIFVLTCLICIIIAKGAFSQTNLPSSIRLGIRTAAFPIGHIVVPEIRDSSTNRIQLGGFCHVFRQELKNQLRRDERNIQVNPQSIENQYRGKGYPRFDGLLKNNIDIECGPNSMSSLSLLDKNGKPFSNNIDFSKPSFYTTGIKLLLRKEEAEKLNSLKQSEQEEALQKLSIGVVKSTTTLQQFEKARKNNFYSNYVPFDSENDQGDARDAALDALERGSSDKGSIQAFASDAVILQTLLKKGVEEDLPYRRYRDPYERDYTLFPAEPGVYLPHLDKQYYIIAVQKNPVGYSANDLKSLITTVLNQPRLKLDERAKIKDYEFEQSSSSTWLQTVLLLLLLIAIIIGFLFWYFNKRLRSSSDISINEEGENTQVNDHPATNPELGHSEYKFDGNTIVQINNHNSTGTQNNTISAQSQEALDDLKRLIADLQRRYPRASEQKAMAIIDAEFEEIQHTQPHRWQNFLSLKRIWNGVKKGSFKAGEHFAEETPWGKAALGFLEGMTDDVEVTD